MVLSSRNFSEKGGTGIKTTLDAPIKRSLYHLLLCYIRAYIMSSFNPLNILQQGAEEERAETARLSSFVGAIAIGDLVKTTLGPKGMDKILVSTGRMEGTIQVTNDGATILRSVGIDNPAAKVLVDISKVQDDEVGDGTTSVAVLASELLREAEKLIAQKIHPQTIIQGWRKALKAAEEALENTAKDNSNNPEQFKEEALENTAKDNSNNPE